MGTGRRRCGAVGARATGHPCILSGIVVVLSPIAPSVRPLLVPLGAVAVAEEEEELQEAAQTG